MAKTTWWSAATSWCLAAVIAIATFEGDFLHMVTVSPSAKIPVWTYWFRLSRDVYGGNRSFASYTKTKTVESAV
jgi:hypothetical protein